MFPLYNDRATRLSAGFTAVFTHVWMGFQNGALGWLPFSRDTERMFFFLMESIDHEQRFHSSPHVGPLLFGTDNREVDREVRFVSCGP